MKYIIINAEAIQKRIEELENYTYDRAYWAGMQFVGEDKGSPNEYISNLKLDI